MLRKSFAKSKGIKLFFICPESLRGRFQNKGRTEKTNCKTFIQSKFDTPLEFSEWSWKNLGTNSVFCLFSIDGEHPWRLWLGQGVCQVSLPGRGEARAGLSLQGLRHAFATGHGLEPLWKEVFRMEGRSGVVTLSSFMTSLAERRFIISNQGIPISFWQAGRRKRALASKAFQSPWI